MTPLPVAGTASTPEHSPTAAEAAARSVRAGQQQAPSATAARAAATATGGKAPATASQATHPMTGWAQPMAVQAGGKYILDVRARVAGSQYEAAAQAIGSFGAMLAPLVSLQPAAMRA
jgi:hypothetical protein